MLSIYQPICFDSRLIESRSPPTIIEKIFLTLGMLMFLIMGGLVLAAIDQVPHALIDNAIVMGLLSFLVAFIFLIDLSDPLPMRRTSHVQTNTNATNEMGIQADNLDQSQVKNGGGSYARNLTQNVHPQVGQRIDKDYPRQPTLPADRRPPPFTQGRPVNPPQLPDQPRPTKHQPNRVAPVDYPRQQPPSPHQQIDVHSDSIPRPQEPIVGHLLTPEKMRARKSKVASKGAFIVDEVPKTRRLSDQHLSEDDTMSRISSQSYVKTTEVDTLPKTSLCRPNESREANRECEEMDSPFVPGYVASTAKMWDKRSKSKPGTSAIIGSNTRV